MTVTKLAEEIGISRKNLYKKAKKYQDYKKLVEIAMNCNLVEEVLDSRNQLISEIICSEDDVKV